MRDKFKNLRAGCIEQNHFGYMWTGQIELRRRKHEKCQELTFFKISDRIECGAKKLCIFHSLFEINCLEGESTLRPFKSLVYMQYVFAFKTYMFISTEVSDELKYNYALVEMYGLDCLSICTTILQVSSDQKCKYITAKKQYHSIYIR